MKSQLKYTLICLVTALSFAGCSDVKSYQMSVLQDECMQTNSQSLEKLENEAESYREGSSGGLGGKTGGGCGCN